MTQQTTDKTVRQRFDQIVVDQRGLDQDPADSVTLEGDLGMDTLDIIELAMELEDHFDVLLDDGGLESAATIGDLFRLVESAQLAEK